MAIRLLLQGIVCDVIELNRVVDQVQIGRGDFNEHSGGMWTSTIDFIVQAKHSGHTGIDHPGNQRKHAGNAVRTRLIATRSKKRMGVSMRQYHGFVGLRLGSEHLGLCHISSRSSPEQSTNRSSDSLAHQCTEQKKKAFADCQSRTDDGWKKYGTE